MFWLWLSVFQNGWTERQHTHLFGLALPYKQAPVECSKEDGSRGARPMCPNVSSPQKRGFLSHTLYIHMYVCISSSENHLGPAWDL